MDVTAPATMYSEEYANRERMFGGLGGACMK